MIKEKLEELHVQSQYRLLEKLNESEGRYRSLYLNAPIGLWEQDWTVAKTLLNRLRNTHQTKLADYLRNSPEEVWRMAESIKILDVNEMALRQVGAATKWDLPSLLNTYLTTDSVGHFIGVLVALAEGKSQYHSEWPLKRLDGQLRCHYLSLIIPPGHEQTLDSVIITSTDITEKKEAENALKASTEFLRMSQLAGGIGTWETNLQTNQQIWSEAVKTSLGFPDYEHPTWDDFLSVIHPDDRQSVIEATQAHLERNERYAIEYRIIDTQHKIRWMCSVGHAQRDDKNQPLFVRGIVQDITERKLAEEKLRLSERIFQTTQEGIMVTDAQGSFVDVNAAFTEISGYSREEVLGKNPRILQSGYHDAAFYAAMWKCINTLGYWSGEIWSRRKDGEVYAELITISAILDDDGKLTHYVGSLSDITLLKQHEKKLERIAHYDALTGVPNRVLLVDRMHQALAQTRRQQNLLAVCYLDLDGFKPINDTLGHAAGDKVLIEIAHRLDQSLRGGDTVARLGGDEFVLLLLGIKDNHECQASLKRILDVIAKPILLDGQHYTVTASIGVTLFPDDDQNSDILLRHADQAMYMAKELGKNRYYLFDHSQEVRLKIHSDERLRIGQGFKGNEFELFYQPKISLANHKVIGAEALIRWRHPERGLLTPDQFLAIIENSALEIVCGEWVIDNALAQIGYWNGEGLIFEVSVNISVNHLQSPLFVQALGDMLARHPDVSANQLQIEILETAALVDIPKVVGIIEECAKLGVSFALDDFGTGYSSLAYLRRLPAEVIKIDRSFVRDMLVDGNDRAIVKGVISLGHTFSRITVAEGIESQAHFELLKELGCDIGQGFAIARPMPANEIGLWYKDYSRKTDIGIGGHSAPKKVADTEEIVWDSKFETGQERIDFEHQIFLGLINNVNKEVKGACDPIRIGRLLNEISGYAKFHFVSEENIMAEINYPELELHQDLHKRLLSRLDDIAASANQEKVDYFSLVDFLYEWFSTHTATADKRIASYIEARPNVS